MTLWVSCFFVILQFIDAVNLHDFVDLNLWYFDDGTLVGKQFPLSTLLSLYSRPRVWTTFKSVQM